MSAEINHYADPASCKKAREAVGEDVLAALAQMFRVPFKERGAIPYALRDGETKSKMRYLCPVCGIRDESKAAHNFVDPDPKKTIHNAGNCLKDQPELGNDGRKRHGAKNREGDRRVDMD